MDFTVIIKQAMDTGMTPEQIADQVAKTLNDIKSKKDASDQRTATLDRMKNSFKQAYCSNSVGVADAADIMTVAYAAQHPEWTSEDIKEFRESSVATLDFHAKILKASPSEAVKMLLEETKADMIKNKTKEKTKRPNIDFPEDILANFVKSL